MEAEVSRTAPHVQEVEVKPLSRAGAPGPGGALTEDTEADESSSGSDRVCRADEATWPRGEADAPFQSPPVSHLAERFSHTAESVPVFVKKKKKILTQRNPFRTPFPNIGPFMRRFRVTELSVATRDRWRATHFRLQILTSDARL